jgi:NADP-dependent 3-hydroxy acid dehydrogenase YdfG
MSEKKVVLITGASSGIGEAVALGLSNGGHTVIVGARRTERLKDLASRIEASGGVARAHRLDVTSRDDFARVVSATLKEFGCVDVIVNSAGIMPLSPLNALKVSEWDQMVDVNIKVF